jgi:hypothetical protein
MATDIIQPTEEEIIAGLDPGIRDAVVLLREHGISTGESCQGGPGHSSGWPWITFGGNEHAGLWAVWLLESAGISVDRLNRTWRLDSGSYPDPYWKVVLQPQGSTDG